jgi:hypothetical protein
VQRSLDIAPGNAHAGKQCAQASVTGCKLPTPVAALLPPDPGDPPRGSVRAVLTVSTVLLATVFGHCTCRICIMKHHNSLWSHRCTFSEPTILYPISAPMLVPAVAS